MKAPTVYPMLAADIGNSSAKFAVIVKSGARPRMLGSIPTADLTAGKIRTLLRRAKARTVAAACVVPAAGRLFLKAAPGATMIGPDSPLNFPTTPTLRRAGADRLANIAEAARRFGRDTLVADFGTAATFDLLDKSGAFAGGAIAPGLHMLAAALSRGTAQLPAPPLARPARAAGRNTPEALQAGVAGGYIGLVRHLAASLAGRGTRIVFTGGDAGAVRRLAGIRALHDPLWTLRGIAVLGELAARQPSK